MSAIVRQLAVTGIPVLVLGAIAAIALRPVPDPAPQPEYADEGGGWIAFDLSALPPGTEIPGWDIRRGEFALVARDGSTVLEMQPEPMVEGKVIRSRLLPAGGGVRARMRGERTRRAWPRYCVGLHGRIEYQFRTVAATKSLELVAGDDVLTSAPWNDPWVDDAGTWLELVALPSSDGTWFLEGRTWPDNGSRPDDASIRHALTAPPGFLRAVVQGAPLALRPVVTDRIEVLQPPAPPSEQP